jgi:hypothetical protein
MSVNASPGSGAGAALATDAGLPLPVTSAAQRSLDEASAAGFGDADFSCVARLLGREPPGPQGSLT